MEDYTNFEEDPHHYESSEHFGPARVPFPAKNGDYVTSFNAEQRDSLYEALVRERETLDRQRCPHLYRLIQQEIDRVANSPQADHSQRIDIINDTPITLNVKCFPDTTTTMSKANSNLAGRLIGPKAAYLKALMQETKTRIFVLGKGAMRDPAKEADLMTSGGLKAIHLNEEMYFSITLTAPPSVAYERMGYAIQCLTRQVTSNSADMLGLPWILRVVQTGIAPPPFDTTAKMSSRPPIAPGTDGEFLRFPPPKPRLLPRPPPDYDPEYYNPYEVEKSGAGVGAREVNYDFSMEEMPVARNPPPVPFSRPAGPPSAPEYQEGSSPLYMRRPRPPHPAYGRGKPVPGTPYSYYPEGQEAKNTWRHANPRLRGPIRPRGAPRGRLPWRAPYGDF